MADDVVVPARIEVASRSSWSQWAVMCSVSMTPPTSGARRAGAF